MRRGFAEAPKGGGLKLLILGGTNFLGPQIVEAATRRGHTMTLFNRGKTHPGLFPDLEKAPRRPQDRHEGARRAQVGRRHRHLGVHSGRRDPVGDAARAERASIPADLDGLGVRQDRQAGTRRDRAAGDDNRTRCGKSNERKLRRAEGVVREGRGKSRARKSDRDPARSDRRSRRFDRSLHLLAGARRARRRGAGSGAPKDFTQFIDVRDLADFIVLCLEKKILGAFNADAQAGSITMGRFLDTCKRVSNSDARFVWADPKFLEEQKIGPWGDMPAWIPPIGDDAGFGQVSAAKAKAAGLRYRPLDDTVRDTLAWFRTEPAEHQAKLKTGLSAEREAEALKAWHARKA
jgi:2'-hydroxyisoflavone reductase